MQTFTYMRVDGADMMTIGDTAGVHDEDHAYA